MTFKINLAQEVFKFFEFAPRSQEKIRISNNILEQNFIPFNEFLSGFGLFIDNFQLRDDLEIKIIDKNNQVLWRRIMGLPIIEGSWWGQEYFIPLGDNYQINSGEEYILIIKTYSTSSLTDFFVKNTLEILQGTESYLYFPENLKKLKLDGIETNYTLKLTLYENKEFVPPVISNLRTEIISATSAKIVFNSNEPVIYSIQYKSDLDISTSTFEINYFENCPYQVKDCQVILDVLPGRNYTFFLSAYDYWQNKTELTGNLYIPLQTREENNFQNTNSSITVQSSNQNQSSITSSKIISRQNNRDSNISTSSSEDIRISGYQNKNQIIEEKDQIELQEREKIVLEKQYLEKVEKKTELQFQQSPTTSFLLRIKNLFNILKTRKIYTSFLFIIVAVLLILILFFKKIKK